MQINVGFRTITRCRPQQQQKTMRKKNKNFYWVLGFGLDVCHHLATIVQQLGATVVATMDGSSSISLNDSHVASAAAATTSPRLSPTKCLLIC